MGTKRTYSTPRFEPIEDRETLSQGGERKNVQVYDCR